MRGPVVSAKPKTFSAHKLSLLVLIYTLLPSKEADSEKLSCMLMCQGFSEWCLSTPSVELEFKPEASFIPGPECVQAVLEAHTGTEQAQQLAAVSCPGVDTGLLARCRASWSSPSGAGRAVQGPLRQGKLILTQHLC